MAGATLIAAPTGIVTSSNPDPANVYSCPECEHRLRVSGLGRHRLYYKLDDEGSHDPVMNRVCPVCGHGLPGKSSS